MKIKMLSIIILMASVSCFSQSNINKAPEKVQVNDWNGTFFMISDYFWNTVKDELIKQMGVDGYENAKKYSKYENMPKEMCVMIDSKNMRNAKEFYAKMCTLKFYKSAVVDFPSSDRGKGGRDVLIMAPYTENKNWDAQAKWDTVYFLIREEFISYLGKDSKNQVK